MIGVLLQAFALGLIGGLVPGAIITILFISVLQGGARQGLQAFGWSLIAELSVAGSLVFAIMLWSPEPVLYHYLGIIGSLVLLYFARGIWQINHLETNVDSRKVYSPIEILFLTATNAPLYIFWVTICVPLIHQLFDLYSILQSASLFFIVFEAGWALSTLGVMMMFVFARPYLAKDHVISKVYKILALVMILLSIKMLYGSIIRLNIF